MILERCPHIKSRYNNHTFYLIVCTFLCLIIWEDISQYCITHIVAVFSYCQSVHFYLHRRSVLGCMPFCNMYTSVYLRQLLSFVISSALSFCYLSLYPWLILHTLYIVLQLTLSSWSAQIIWAVFFQTDSCKIM